MSYSQVKVIVKHPSKELEEFVLDMGIKKNERLEALREKKEADEVIQVK